MAPPKGFIPWNKGKKCPQISKALKGTKRSEEYKKKLSDLLKGKERRGNPNNWKHTKETKRKLSKTQKGKHTNLITEFKKGQTPWNKGKKLPKKDYPNFGFRTSRQNQIFPKIDTSIEVKIQEFLKQLGIEFFTHQYMKIEHGYQCDILIPAMNLVIECDGNYWHKYPVGTEIDKIRTKELIEKGFKVLRLWGSEIKTIKINSFKQRLKNG